MEEQFVPKPDSHMALAVFTTLCCCLPFGIVAIIKASKVNDLWIMKQYDAAYAAASDAKKWALIALGCGIAIELLYLVIYGGAILSGVYSSYL